MPRSYCCNDLSIEPATTLGGQRLRVQVLHGCGYDGSVVAIMGLPLHDDGVLLQHVPITSAAQDTACSGGAINRVISLFAKPW